MPFFYAVAVRKIHRFAPLSGMQVAAGLGAEVVAATVVALAAVSVYHLVLTRLLPSLSCLRGSFPTLTTNVAQDGELPEGEVVLAAVLVAALAVAHAEGEGGAPRGALILCHSPLRCSAKRLLLPLQHEGRSECGDRAPPSPGRLHCARP